METKVSLFLVLQLGIEEMLLDGMIGTEGPSQLRLVQGKSKRFDFK